MNILGDYNDDERVDDADLDIFREVWDDQDIRRELGPATGAPPDLVPYPDGVIDFEDLVVFGLMWMWSTDKHAIAPAPWVTSASQAGTPSYLPKLEIGNDHVLNISIPTDGLMGCISLEYDANIISISPLEQFSGSNMTFLSDIEHPGHIALAFVDLGLVKDKGRTSTFAANLDWKAKADDVQIVFHYDMRDLQNRTIAMGTEIRTIRHLPQANALLQNYPNPFNPDTWIPFRLAEDADVTIRIYNSLGQLVRGLDLGHRTAGFYTSKERAAHWDGKNESGEYISSGIYLYSLRSASGLTITRKMVIVR